MHPPEPFVADDGVGKEFCGQGKQRSRDWRPVGEGFYEPGMGKKGIKVKQNVK